MKFTQLLVAQRLASDAAQNIAISLRIANGGIPTERLPIYFVSDSELVSATARMRYTRQRLPAKELKALKEQAELVRDALKDIIETRLPDVDINSEVAVTDFENALAMFKTDLEELATVEVPD